MTAMRVISVLLVQILQRHITDLKLMPAQKVSIAVPVSQNLLFVQMVCLLSIQEPFKLKNANIANLVSIVNTDQLSRKYVPLEIIAQSVLKNL